MKLKNTAKNKLNIPNIQARVRHVHTLNDHARKDRARAFACEWLLRMMAQTRALTGADARRYASEAVLMFEKPPIGERLVTYRCKRCGIRLMLPANAPRACPVSKVGDVDDENYVDEGSLTEQVCGGELERVKALA